jgi:hypothetical protein
MSGYPSNPFNNNYQVMYGVTLLDDLHNYFPEILYNPQRFETVPQLLFYFQRQLSTRFNLFQQGRNSYFESMPNSSDFFFRSAATGAPVFNTTVPLWRTGGASTATAGGAAGGVGSGFDSGGLGGVRDTSDITLSPLLSLLRAVNMPVHATFNMREREDVIIRPTPAQIRSASVLLTGPPRPSPLAQSQEQGQTQEQEQTQQDQTETNTPPASADFTCAVCQDVIGREDACRQLQHCRHAFHQTCIDQWFQRNVRCPVCRHDIRNLNSS